MRQLTSLDAQFLALESPSHYGHVGGLAIYDPSTAPDGVFGIENIKAMVLERLPLLPPFRWRLAQVPFGLDHPYWIEAPHFDIDFHVREIGIAPPGTDDKLADAVARIFARPLDRDHPLWELHVIHGLPDGHVAMLTKIHHAVVDGVSGAEILSVLMDLTPEGREAPPPSDAQPEAIPSELEMLARGLVGLPRQPLRALKGLPSTLASLPAIPGAKDLPGMGTLGALTRRSRRLRGAPELLEFPKTVAPQTPLNGAISRHRRFAFGQLSLDTVKALKNTHDVTVNDVVVCLCAGAIRGWLIEHGALPTEPLVAMVPMSVRTEEQMGTFGNRVSMMVAPLATDEPDLEQRLLRTHTCMAKAKERYKALPADALTDATQFIPPAVAALAARTTLRVAGNQRSRPLFNVIISNVPGPRMPLYCAGAELQANYPVSVVTHGVGLNITVMSYRDHLDFGIIADRELVPDVEMLMDGLHTALEELTELSAPAQPRRAAPKRRAAASR